MRLPKSGKLVALTAAVVVGIIAFSLISLLGARTSFEPLPQGDQLGQDPGETFAEYTQRAADSLRSAPADEPVYALVTFETDLSPSDASRALEPLTRVSAVLTPDAAPRAVGEPATGRDRSGIFELAAGGSPITGAVVRDSGAAVRSIAQQDGIAVVETLPPDAVWGAFGVRPVEFKTEPRVAFSDV